MTIGAALPAGDLTGAANSVEALLAQTREAAAAGLRSVWFSQLFDHDALTLAALAGREVPEVAVGTAVVPLYPRHPLHLAAQAQTVQAATGGRFTLGLGLGVQSLLEPAFGFEYPPPITSLRESLTVLRDIFEGRPPAFDGETLTACPPLPTTVPGGGDVPIVVAAMGRQALRVAGELADGTLPFLAGPRALAEHIVPTLTKAAADAGRPEPRVIAAVPAVVTDDVETVRQIAAVHLGYYGDIPSYRRILEIEGVAHAADLALVGDERVVAAGLRRYFDAGATEVVLIQSGMRSPRERLRTWQLAGSLQH
ncbi:TIGR03564 family F420-dependent LLM class oxidoreductase [Amycolatopsis sp. cmx-4-61]|uniref:TIGR03564 family F420-dependent LLM class oxidoreductase n=1 Tax=Amycolatopsis sp. cmx-4-61 TaxID=2790937 RepID=UPI003977FEED